MQLAGTSRCNVLSESAGMFTKAFGNKIVQQL